MFETVESVIERHSKFAHFGNILLHFWYTTQNKETQDKTRQHITDNTKSHQGKTRQDRTRQDNI